jgi:hypothetical protein
LQYLRRRSWNTGSFHNIGGILSGPKAFSDLVWFKAVQSSVSVNSAIDMSSLSEILILGKEIFSGSFGSVPRRL